MLLQFDMFCSKVTIMCRGEWMWGIYTGKMQFLCAYFKFLCAYLSFCVLI